MGEIANKGRTKGNPSWQKGVSGNPSGRPAVAKEFRERCREFMESEGWTSLISMAQNPKDRDRYRALDLLAAYAYGKPKQGLEVSGADGGPLEISTISTADLAAKARELAGRVDKHTS